jgi:hypothetical protein
MEHDTLFNQAIKLRQTSVASLRGQLLLCRLLLLLQLPHEEVHLDPTQQHWHTTPRHTAALSVPAYLSINIAALCTS